jgi:hypothetical protein
MLFIERLAKGSASASASRTNPVAGRDVILESATQVFHYDDVLDIYATLGDMRADDGGAARHDQWSNRWKM